MALTNTGAGATTPSNPDYRFALHTREGVGDYSGRASETSKQIDIQTIGQGVEAAGKLAGEVYQGYQLGALQKDITEKVVNPFIERLGQTELSGAEQAQAIATHDLERSAYNQQKQSIFQNFMDTGEMSQASLEESITANAASVKKSSDKLQAALKQGQMSQQEFELRLNSTIREAINKNPGMAQELMAHGQRVAAASGIRIIPDLKNAVDKEAAMLERKKLDFKLAQHKEVKTHIDIDEYLQNPEYASIKDAETAEKYRGLEYNNQLEQRVKNGELMTKEEGLAARPLMASSTTAKFLEFSSQAHALAAQAKTGSIQEKADIALQLTAYAETLIALHRDNLIKNNLPRGDVNDHINNLNRATKNIIDTIKNDVSGKPIAELLNTQISSQNAAIKLQLDEQFGVEGLKYLSSIASPSIKDAWDRLDRSGTRKDKVLRGLIELGSGYNSGAALDAVISRDMSPNATNAVTALKGTMEAKDYENAEKIIQGIELHTVKLKDSNFTAENIDKKLEAQESFISEMGKPEYKGKLNFGTTVQTNATNIIRDYLVDAGTVFRREMDKWNNEPHSKNYSVKLSTKLVNGQLKVIGEGVDVRGIYNRQTGQQIADKIEASVGTAFNRGVKAMANLHDTNWERGSQQLLDAIDQDWYLPEGEGSLSSVGGVKVGKRGQNENNPLNLKEPGQDRFQQFGTKEDGIKASYNQLLRYYEGNSKNVSGPTTVPADMLKIWNNASEKGSASDTQYANNVASFSGLDLTQPIAKGDTGSWVDLIYGMAKAEGAKSITRNEIRKAIGG